MKYCYLTLVFCFTQMSWGQPISSYMANVCLSIEPYAEVGLIEEIKLTAVDQSTKNVPSRYRGETTLILQSNTDVELLVTSLDLVGDNRSFQPSVTLNNAKEILSVPYSDAEHQIDLRMDVKVAQSEIVKAGVYEGEVNVIVMANIGTMTCL